LVHIMNGDPLRAFQELSLAKELAIPDSPIAELADRLLKSHFP
jgi:hypothetical protein